MSRRPPPLLVDGILDTGAGGKTLVSRAIVRALQRAGVKVVPLKLVETGCIECDGQLEPADGVALAHAAGGVFPLEVVAPGTLRTPCGADGSGSPRRPDADVRAAAGSRGSGRQRLHRGR